MAPSIMDPAHLETNKIIKEIEKRIAEEYRTAHLEVTKKLDEYLAAYKAKDKIWRQKVANGQKTLSEYRDWVRGQVLIGQRWSELKDTLATDYANAAQIAKSVTDGYMPEVYAINHNYATFDIERGSLMDTSYTLYSRETVERLFRENPKIYHNAGAALQRALDSGAVKAWNRQRIQSVITQGVLQGESIPKIARRMQKVTHGSYSASVRNARTMMTCVQNAGRIDSYDRANKMGIKTQKQWIATLDNRTRHAHRELDGAIADNDKPFENSIGMIMYPGDPEADPDNIYNCFIGETNVATDSDIIRSYKHNYSGELITVKTASGVEFTCTPNHPILTPSGWVAAKSLNDGDNLLIASIGEVYSLRVNPYIDHTPSRIDAIHKFFDVTGSKRTIRLGVDFHGDVPTSDVEVITQKRLLRGNRYSCGADCVDELLLKHSDKAFAGKSAFMQHFGGVRLAALRIMCGFGKSLALFRRSLTHAVIHRFGTIARSDATTFETQADSVTGNVQFFGESPDGFSGKVFIDNIVNVNITTVSHIPVYNLQTGNSRYFVNSITSQNGEKCNGNFAIAHNCRCTLVAAIEGLDNSVTDLSIRNNRKLGSMTYEEWKEAKVR